MTDRIIDGLPTVISGSKRYRVTIEESWEQFADGQSVKNLGHHGHLPRSEVVARARAQLGQPWSLFANNCEHTVTRAQGLEPRSDQLRTAVVAAGLVVALVAAEVDGSK